MPSRSEATVSWKRGGHRTRCRRDLSTKCNLSDECRADPKPPSQERCTLAILSGALLWLASFSIIAFRHSALLSERTYIFLLAAMWWCCCMKSAHYQEMEAVIAGSCISDREQAPTVGGLVTNDSTVNMLRQYETSGHKEQYSGTPRSLSNKSPRVLVFAEPGSRLQFCVLCRSVKRTLEPFTVLCFIQKYKENPGECFTVLCKEN